MVKDLIFIKLGGSAITDKSKQGSLKNQVIHQVAREISELKESYSILLGLGGGSFAHPVAKKHDVASGIIANGAEGFNLTRRAVTELAKKVCNIFELENLFVSPVSGFSCTIMTNRKVSNIFSSPIQAYLTSNKIPMISGDVCLDSVCGSSIASTEMLFSALEPILNPKKIILGANVDGVLDKNGNLIPNISSKNMTSVLEQVAPVQVDDVTGGMQHKIKLISQFNTDSCIINLEKPGRLTKAVLGEEVPCTQF